MSYTIVLFLHADDNKKCALFEQKRILFDDVRFMLCSIKFKGQLQFSLPPPTTTAGQNKRCKQIINKSVQYHVNVICFKVQCFKGLKNYVAQFKFDIFTTFAFNTKLYMFY